MLKIYHNSRCRKSRAGLEALQASGKEYLIVDYLKEKFTANALKSLIKKTGMPVIDLIRTQESYFKENIKGKNFNDEALIEAILTEPKLLQRPIVEDEHHALLADPIENLDKIL